VKDILQCKEARIALYFFRSDWIQVGTGSLPLAACHWNRPPNRQRQ